MLLKLKLKLLKRKVSTATKIMAFASCVSVFIVFAQFLFSLYGTTKISGEISISQREEKIEQLKKELKQTT